MVRRAALAIASVFLLGTGVASAQQPRGVVQAAAVTTVNVKVGAKKVIGVPDIARVAVKDPEIADIRVGDGGEVEITGRAAGRTEVHVWTRDGQKMSYEIAVTR
ncbi:MAG: pilus assembly protein N-terminal domain-containing protein [Myxococcaceae bacterium]|nr:pilus assembly protein N-terminal domain-containing protein [Myxococcaceae bacterium]